MPDHIIEKDKHNTRKIYDQYSHSIKSRKLSLDFEERLSLSSEDRCFRIKVVGVSDLERLLMVIEKIGAKPIPGGWNKALNMVIVYATKSQVIELSKHHEVKYIRYYESADACEL